MNKFQLLNDGLIVNKISKTYGSKQVVRDINLTIKRGEIVGLLGPNGAGKTTTFYIIVGLVKSDSGSILLDKGDISNLPIYSRGQMGISYLPQEASIFRGMNVEDNLLSIIEITEPEKNKQEIILQSLLNEFDINHVRKSKSIVLSGGERRRLEIARTLASNPKYLLLDEPLTGIDPVSIEEIKTIIKKLKEKNIGILITGHNVRETLKIVEDKLNSQNSWIFGNHPSFLDIAILPFVRQYRIADIAWFDEAMPLRKTHRWLMQFLDWQTFIRSMAKYKIWESQDKPVYFGQ